MKSRDQHPRRESCADRSIIGPLAFMNLTIEVENKGAQQQIATQ
jgi:hypothetical protein